MFAPESDRKPVKRLTIGRRLTPEEERKAGGHADPQPHAIVLLGGSCDVMDGTHPCVRAVISPVGHNDEMSAQFQRWRESGYIPHRIPVDQLESWASQ